MITRSSAAARPSVAIVGSGISGLTAAYLLTRTHDVTLFESDNRLGGHAHTHDLTASDGSRHCVDSGFIVHNDRTYPWLRKLFAELEVEVRPTEMSMSVGCAGCGVEYAGGRGLRGILAQPGRMFDPRFVRLMLQVKRFHRRAAAFLRCADPGDLTTYGAFLQREGFSEYFITHYAVPVVSCVWSSGREAALLYPARYLFRFLDQHGMLRVTGSPQWYTIVGGSRTYVERVSARLDDVRTSRAVTDITRRPHGVEIRDANGQVALFDCVVIATHADQALNLLTDPTDDEVDALKAFGYARNQAILHTDASILPDTAAARACWNYQLLLYVTSAATGRDVLDEPAAGTRLTRPLPGHPERARRHRSRPGRCGHGLRAPDLHTRGSRCPVTAGVPRDESDGLRRRISRLGIPRGRLLLRSQSGPAFRSVLVTAATVGTKVSLPSLPALVIGHITHHRSGPVRHAFRHGVYQWLVDLDALPEEPWYLRPFASFRPADHLGDPNLSIKANVENFVALNGVRLGSSSRVVMLANARVLGHVFDPLSVFWCFDANTTLTCIVAEVHNTHRERHVYLLHPDAAGAARTEKALHVSPFFDVSGHYELRFGLAPDVVSSTVILRREGAVAFAATFRGPPVPATTGAVIGQLLRRPLMPQRVSALIRMHGVRLWIRRLPTPRRPTHRAQEGV
ncbi:MAG TPA: FAD-dependent oxidoreductase [Acidothermaceae bacterium]